MQRGAVRWCAPNGAHTNPHTRSDTVAGRFRGWDEPSRTVPQNRPARLGGPGMTVDRCPITAATRSTLCFAAAARRWPSRILEGLPALIEARWSTRDGSAFCATEADAHRIVAAASERSAGTGMPPGGHDAAQRHEAHPPRLAARGPGRPCRRERARAALRMDDRTARPHRGRLGDAVAAPIGASCARRWHERRQPAGGGPVARGIGGLAERSAPMSHASAAHRALDRRYAEALARDGGELAHGHALVVSSQPPEGRTDDE